MEDTKYIILSVKSIANEIIVAIAHDSYSPGQMKQFLNSLNLTTKQKIKYNKDITNCVKEFKLDMTKCSREIEIALENNNKKWEEKINKLILEQEQQKQFNLEQGNKLKEQENKFKEQEEKMNKLKQALKENDIDFEF